MKKQNTLFITLVFLSQTTMVFASETNTAKNTAETLNQAHIATPSAAAKDLPFWSKDQTKQAELEAKYKNEIAENPENKQVYSYLAGLYLTNNKTSEAIDAYQDAISQDPENPKLFAGISIAYLHRSKFAMARAMADEALRLDPSLTQVKKINEYIVAKEAAISAAADIPLENTGKQATGSGSTPKDAMHGTLGAAPEDAMHGAMDNTLQVDNPSAWVKTE